MPTVERRWALRSVFARGAVALASARGATCGSIRRRQFPPSLEPDYGPRFLAGMAKSHQQEVTKVFES
jgi:hypothetical protein